jgi:glycosyltransferase involved in cell wall biosynthesis
MLTINGRFLGQRTTGVQRYAREILAELDLLFHETGTRPALKARIVVPAEAEVPALRRVEVQRAGGNGVLWEQLVLPALAQGVTLSLGNVGPLLSSKHIVCIHDVNVLTAPASYSWAFRSYYRIMQPLLGRRAARVATVSSFSARMLSESRVCRPEKISVIPNGHEHVRRWRPASSSFAARDASARPFVFTLGSRAPHKNIEMLLGLAAELDAIGLDIRVAGISGNIFSAVETNAVPPNVRFLGFVTDDDLAALYRNALCFAFPSLTEGFGLPALEALALGCPVIASTAASLPEVCGDAALYADPRSPRAWLAQIKRLHAEPDIGRALRAEAARQVEKFSWARSARQYFDLVLSLDGDVDITRDRAASELE